MITIKTFRYPEMLLNGGGLFYFGLPDEIPKSPEFIRNYRTWVQGCLRLVVRDGGYAIVQIPIHFFMAQLPRDEDVVNFVGDENRHRISMIHFVEGNTTEWRFLLATFHLLRTGLSFDRLFKFVPNPSGYWRDLLVSTPFVYVDKPKLFKMWSLRKNRKPVIELKSLWGGVRWRIYQKFFQHEIIVLVSNACYAKWRNGWKRLSSN